MKLSPNKIEYQYVFVQNKTALQIKLILTHVKQIQKINYFSFIKHLLKCINNKYNIKSVRGNKLIKIKIKCVDNLIQY